MSEQTISRRTMIAAAAGALAAQSGMAQSGVDTNPQPLKPPAEGKIRVAFPISEGAVVIDWAGPWEVFQDANLPTGGNAFEMYTVAETRHSIKASGGLQIIPDYTFADAPEPKVIVIPAQKGNDAMIEWIKKTFPSTDLIMSVCTGAFLLAKTGLLAGKAATTHHASYGPFQMAHRDIKVKRGYRFVEVGSNLATSGGLSSGIDFALRVVERYFGRELAEGVAFSMEYQGEGWKDSTGAANQVYAKPRVGANQLACPV